MIRLNTTTNQFEGYHNSNWQGLGGVIDVDQDTYVSTEKTSDDDTLFFYTAGSERARILSDGRVGIGTTTPSNTLDINGGLELNGESYIRSTSNVGLRIQTTDQGITNSD